MTGLHDSLARLRIRLVLGACAMGLVAGLVGFSHGGNGAGWWAAALSGMVMVIFLGAAGGVAGMFLRSLWSWLRPAKDTRETPDFADSLGLGALAGAFLGFIVVLTFLDWSLAAWGTALGAALGAALAVGFGETVQVLLTMAVKDSLAGREDRDEDL